jgi:hypothetical protein
MLDEMTNSAVADHVLDCEDATELELELAQRLIGSLEEIDRLVEERAQLLCELAQKLEHLSGDA